MEYTNDVCAHNTCTQSTLQESAQSKQQIFLSDLKTSINQIRYDAQRKLSDYQKEITNAERDVATAEKKLGKSKEAQEKGFEYRNKYDKCCFCHAIPPSSDATTVKLYIDLKPLSWMDCSTMFEGNQRIRQKRRRS